MFRRKALFIKSFDTMNPFVSSSSYDRFMEMICTASKENATRVLEMLLDNPVTYLEVLTHPDFDLEEFISALEEHTTISAKCLLGLSFTGYLKDALIPRLLHVSAYPIPNIIFGSASEINKRMDRHYLDILHFAQKTLDGVTLSQAPLQVCLSFIDDIITNSEKTYNPDVLNQLKALLNAHGEKKKFSPTSTQLIYAVINRRVETKKAEATLDEDEELAMAISLSLKLAEEQKPTVSPWQSNPVRSIWNSMDDHNTTLLSMAPVCESQAPTKTPDTVSPRRV